MRNSSLKRTGMVRVNDDHTKLPVTHTFWINNRQNLRWSITSMNVHRCLWHGAQLRLRLSTSGMSHTGLYFPAESITELWPVLIFRPP